MIISQAEASLFFKLMLPLQFFVNEKLVVLPQIVSFEEYCRASMKEKFAVREALFENVGLIDEFIDENPHDVPMKNLSIVARWKNFLKGDFFVERYLKDAAILISDEAEVYAVKGVSEPLAKYFPKFALPVRINTILLPFQNQIVLDGFFLPDHTIYGEDAKTELKEIYSAAKKKNKIITVF